MKEFTDITLGFADRTECTYSVATDMYEEVLLYLLKKYGEEVIYWYEGVRR